MNDTTGLCRNIEDITLALDILTSRVISLETEIEDIHELLEEGL